MAFPSGWDLIGTQLVGQIATATPGQPLAVWHPANEALMQLQSMLSAPGMAGLAASIWGLQNSLPQIQDEAGQQAENLKSRITGVVGQLSGINQNLDKTVADNGRETIDKLELALTKTYKLAVFIRGNYDARDVDENQQKDIIAQAVASFADVDSRATFGLKTIGDIHAQVMEIQNLQIGPMRGEIQILTKTNNEQIETVRNQLESTRNSLDTYRRNLNTQQEAMSSLQDKIHENENASLASDIGFGILLGPIGLLAGGGKPIDPFNLRGQLDDSRRNYEAAQRGYNDTMRQLQELQNTEAQLQQRAHFADQLKGSLPQIETSASNLEAQSISLQRQFRLLKDTASQLLIAVKGVESRAVVAQATAITKKEFAVALLDICDLSIIDPRVVDEVNMIAGEVMAGYEKTIPDEVSEGNETVKGKIEQLNNHIAIRS